LLSGKTPFDVNNEGIILTELTFAEHIKPEAVDLIKKLLIANPSERLGCGSRGIVEIKEHPFFKEIEFDKLIKLELHPPYIPNKNMAHCSPIYEFEEQIVGDDKKRNKNIEVDQNWFKNFDYNTKIQSAQESNDNTETTSADMSNESVEHERDKKKLMIIPYRLMFLKMDPQILYTIANHELQV